MGEPAYRGLSQIFIDVTHHTLKLEPAPVARHHNDLGKTIALDPHKKTIALDPHKKTIALDPHKKTIALDSYKKTIALDPHKKNYCARQL